MSESPFKNVLIKEACIVISPSNETIHAKVGEVFTLTNEEAGSIQGSNRGFVTDKDPFRLPDEDATNKPAGKR